jgi:hypothetical protein
MRTEEIKKESNRIALELIIMHKNKNLKNKTLLELYEELLNKDYKKYYYEILVKIPNILSENNYEILNSKYLKLKEYK